MNATNRALNRAVILLVGIVLIAAGVAVAVAASVPQWLEVWSDGSARVTDALGAAVASASLGFSDHSWILVAGAALAVLAAVLVAVFMLRQGRGHTRTVLSEGTSEHGRTEVDASLAANALEDAIGSRPEFIATHVSAYRVRRTPALKVAVTCRRGVSPKDAADIVDDAVRALDELLGRPLPALVQISGGFRARVGSSTRLQ